MKQQLISVEELEGMEIANSSGGWLEDATPGDLVKAYAVLSVFGGALDQLKSGIKDRLIAAMDERGSTKLPIGDYVVTVTSLEARRRPNFDAGALKALEPLVDPDTFAKAMNFRPSPSWKVLKELMKFGGKVKEVIEGAQAGWKEQGTTLKVEKSDVVVLEGNEGDVELPISRGQLNTRDHTNEWEVEKHNG